MAKRWIGLLMFAGLACSEPQPAPHSAPAKPVEVAKPVKAAKPAGPADQLVESMVDYVMTIAAIPFTGDCEAWVKAALNAEPIMLRLRQEMTALASNPDRDAIRADVEARAPAASEAALKARGLTLADYDSQEVKIHTTCKGNAAFEAAMPRIAMKKKSAPQP
jgi:hypothetical protein